ncbi:hypothetical protein QL093DRAFT_2083747 [Fusarium oxysporum]|nr:hypothetical protein QL093DRAFT_2083747 [Fusarium oxysporum]
MSYKPVAIGAKVKVDPAAAMLNHEPSTGSGIASKAKRKLSNPRAASSGTLWDMLSSTPQKPFSNRYLDPNHPASNDGVLGLLSEGELTPDLEKQREIDENGPHVGPLKEWNHEEDFVTVQPGAGVVIGSTMHDLVQHAACGPVDHAQMSHGEVLW